MAEHVVSWRVALSKAQVLKQEKLAKKRKKELAASQKELEQVCAVYRGLLVGAGLDVS